MKKDLYFGRVILFSYTIYNSSFYNQSYPKELCVRVHTKGRVIVLKINFDNLNLES